MALVVSRLPLVLLTALLIGSLAPVAAGQPMAPSMGVPVVPPCVPGSIAATVGWFNSTGFTQQTPMGAAPTNVTIGAMFTGPAGLTIGYNLSFGDGSSSSGSGVTAANGSWSVRVGHDYTLPALYPLNLTAQGVCGSPNATASSQAVLQVYGAGGPNPITLTDLQTSPWVGFGYAQYNATVAGLPANASTVWNIRAPAGLGQWEVGGNINSSTDQVIPQGAGNVSASMVVVYPNGWIYAEASLPDLTFAAPLQINITNTTVAAGSPTSGTFTAHVAPAPGAPVITSSSPVSWAFSGLMRWPTGILALGPPTGSSVNYTFYDNGSAGANTTLTLLAYENGPSSCTSCNNTTVVFGYGAVTVDLSNLTGPTFPAVPALALSLEPGSMNLSGGRMVFVVDSNVSYTSGTPPPPPVYYHLALDANNTCACQIASWQTNITIVGGAGPVAATVNVSVANYTVTGRLWSWTACVGAGCGLLAATNLSVSPYNTSGSTGSSTGGSSGGGTPVSLSLTVAPANGSAPLNVSIDLSAAGGSGAFNATLCLRGPSTSSPATGPCISLGAWSAWNGSTLRLVSTLNRSGNYSVNASLVDSAGSTASAGAPVVVGPAVPRPALSARATLQSTAAAEAGTVAFTAEVSGGVAPYTIQWAFGDGTFGSSAVGGTVTHTFTRSGTFTAILTVIDGAGHVATATVGPFTVTLPGAGVAGGLSTSDSLIFLGLGLVAAVSVALIVSVVVQLRSAREAEEWLRELEGGEAAALSRPAEATSQGESIRR